MIGWRLSVYRRLRALDFPHLHAMRIALFVVPRDEKRRAELHEFLDRNVECNR